MSAAPRISADWLTAAGPRAVFSAIEAGGRRAYFVGGCVRDALLERAVFDFDIATDARPEQVVQLATAAGLKAVPTGIAHGTVTVIHDGAPMQVTTFRRDVATDGRRAVVAFSDDLAEDAARRDFTMNALYARLDGSVIDPLGGLADLRDGRVRFVGDPAARISEDYLRILRFFRFHAWFGDPAAGIDAEGLAACAAAADGLERLSRERVGAEVTRLLAAPDPAPAIAAMAASGVLARVLPGADPAALAPLAHLEAEGGIAPSWRRRLASMGPAADWVGALRLSKDDARALEATAASLAADAGPAVEAYRFGAEAARDAALIRSVALGAPPPASLEAEIARGASAALPLRAADLPHLAGAALGDALKRAEAAWVASDFRLDRAALKAIASGARA